MFYTFISVLILVCILVILLIRKEKNNTIKAKRVKLLGLITLMVIFILSAFTSCFGEEAASQKMKDNNFKVVGYYSYEYFDEPIEKVQTNKLTHIMYGFLIPKNDGTFVDFKKPEQLKELVVKAHKDGVKIFISIGGWSSEGKPLEPVFKELAASNEKRKFFIENVCSLVEEYNLDGVELDWEHPNKSTAADYEKMVIEMSDALNVRGKELTAALNGSWYSDWAAEDTSVITEECLKRFSFINVMAYDMNNDAHSPIWFFENSISYWLFRGLPPEKIVMGMPLYAKPSWLQYRNLVAQNPEYAYSDYAPTTPLESNYNGINTLREKTIIALNRAGGVMLFDINEDTNDETSVVSMIDDLLLRIRDLSKDEFKKYITVVLDNRELVFVKEDGLGTPFIDKRNRIMIPLRKSLEAIGASVEYDEEKSAVNVKKGETTIKISINNNIILVNGKEAEMDTNAVVMDQRVYIPLRSVFEALGYKVEWHENSRTVTLSDN
nr:glycosyl hydrolase family 18 protein [Sedimentibacter sp.]